MRHAVVGVCADGGIGAKLFDAGPVLSSIAIEFSSDDNFKQFRISLMTNARLAVPTAMLIAVAALVAVCRWNNVAAQDKAITADVRWSYKVRVVGHDSHLSAKELEDVLNDLGEDGWECLGTVSEVKGGSASQKDENRTNAVLILKRPKK